MKVEKIGDNLAVVIPADVAETLGLHEGDSVEVRRNEVPKRLNDAELAELWARFRALSRPLPEGFRFDREEANAR
ncbi:AbrB/MazE/SpoVT family DNA-binding domain-containing protein [Sphingomonas hankookensis]|uniref:AbrB/MazE/SpoVT family DNA-binding domain-containing protein n=1 Tax=Sphingomonas hankookensis TaxID=563996 RepID=UPI001F5A460E